MNNDCVNYIHFIEENIWCLSKVEESGIPVLGESAMRYMKFSVHWSDGSIQED